MIYVEKRKDNFKVTIQLTIKIVKNDLIERRSSSRYLFFPFCLFPFFVYIEI